MAKKFYTIMIVPHAAAKFRRVRVSRNLLITAGSVIGVLSICGLLIPHFLWTTSSLRASLAVSEQENAELRQTNEQFDASISDLRGKLAEIESKLRDLRRMRRALRATLEACACGGDLSHCDALDGLAEPAGAPQRGRTAR